MSRPASRRLLMTAAATDGIWRHALTLAGALTQRDWQVRLALSGPPPDDLQRAEIGALDGADIVLSGLPGDGDTWDPADPADAAAALVRLAREDHCDVVQLDAPVLAAAGDWPVPVIGITHRCAAARWATTRPDPMPAELARQRDMTRDGLIACTRLVAPSLAFADLLRATYGIERRIEVVHVGVAPHLAASLEHPETFAFTAGRLWDEVKNTPLLDAVAARLKVPFLAAGAASGPLGQRVVLRHLRHLGRISAAEIETCLARRPIFVSAAILEPFGMAVLEAAQAGCALVLADTPGFRELWGGAAAFVAADDAEGFITAIEELVADPALRHRMGIAARCRAADYPLKGMADSMAALYEDVLNECQAA